MTKLKSIIFNDKELKSNIDGTKIYYDGNYINQILVKPKHSTKGFLQCSLNGVKVYVHRIVAMIFIPNPDNLPFSCHVDTDTLNNHYKNIAWGNQRFIAQNMRVAKRFIGQNSKIPQADIQMIVIRLRNGEFARTIATEYCTSDMSLIRLKKKYKIQTNITIVHNDYFKQFVKEHLEAYHSINKVTSELGVSKFIVWRWNKVWQIPIYRRSHLTPEIKEQIRQELISGKSYKDVCIDFSDVCSNSTVYKIYNSK